MIVDLMGWISPNEINQLIQDSWEDEYESYEFSSWYEVSEDLELFYY